MKTKLLLLVCLSFIFTLSCTRTPKDKGCRYLQNEDMYQSYDANDGVWRTILLPGTKFGMTITTLPMDPDKKPVQTPNEIGHPLKLEEVDENLLNDVRVVYWQKVENGCYCVEKLEDGGFQPWTVWTPEVFNAVKSRKTGLGGPSLPSYPKEPLNVFENTQLPKVVTETSADKASGCVSDILKGKFKGKKFWIANAGLRDNNLGQYVVEQLEKRGAKYEYENHDFGVNTWLEAGYPTILKENGSKKLYRDAKLDINFSCVNHDLPKISNNLEKEPVVFVNTEIQIHINALVAQIEDKNASEWDLTVEKLKPLIAQAIP